MNIDAVLFDMDGVVVDSMKFHADAWIRVLGEYGIRLEDIDIFKREGMPGRESIEDICLEKGIPVPGVRDLDLLHEKKHVLFEAFSISLYPGIVELLDCLDGRSIAAALVTGSLRRAVEHVLPDEVRSRFRAIITAEDVAHGKPDPDPYLKALEKLSLTAEKSLVVENSPMGVRSACQAGIRCIALETTLPAKYLLGADMIFKNHDGLYDFIVNGIEIGRPC